MWRAVLLVSIASASPARASAFHDPESGLRIEVGGADTTVCYVRPAALRDAGCAGKDVDAAEMRLGGSQRMLALVERPGASYAVAATWILAPGAGPLTPAVAEEILRGAREAPERAGFEVVDEHPQLVAIHGLELVTFAMTSPDGGTIVQYIVRTGGDLVAIQFVGDVPLPRLRELAATTIATLSLPVPEALLGTHAVALAIVLATISCALLAFVALRLRRVRAGDDDDDVDLWALQQRRAAGLRIAAVGQLVWVPAMVWLVVYGNWDTDAPVTRIKVVGGTAVAIGLVLTIAGFIMIARARRRPLPAAIARRR